MKQMIQHWKVSVEVQEFKSGVGFLKKNGLLYHRWIPKGCDEKMSTCSTREVSQSCDEACSQHTPGKPFGQE